MKKFLFSLAMTLAGVFSAIVIAGTLPSGQSVNIEGWETTGTAPTTTPSDQTVPTDLRVPEPRAIVTEPFMFIVNAVAAVADTVAAHILAFLVLIALCFLIAAILFVSFLSDAVIFAGLCLGPLILALTPMKFFRGMIPQYIKFMLTGVFYKLVAAVFVVMITKSMILSAGAINSDTIKWVMMIGMLIQIFIMIAVVKQAPAVASSLIGGFSMSASGPGLGTVALLAGKVK